MSSCRHIHRQSLLRVLGVIMLALTLQLTGCGPRESMTREECDKSIGQAVDALWHQDYVKSLELMSKVRDVAYRKGWKEQYFWSLDLLAMTNYRMSDTEEARDLFLKAYKYADDNMTEEFRVSALSNMSTFYIEESEFKPAKDSYQKILEYALRVRNRELAGTAYMNLCTILRHESKTDSALYMINRALESIPDSLKLKRLDAKVLKAETLLEGGRRDEARSELESVINTLGHDSLSSPYFKAITLMATLRADTGDISGAFIDASRLACGDIVAQKNRMELLRDISYKGKDYQRAYIFSDSLREIDDSIARMRTRLLHESSQIKFELMASESKLQRQHNFITISSVIGVIVVILLIAVIVHFRHRARYNRQKRVIAEQQKRISDLELKRAEDERLILENELESSNRELTAQAFSLASRNDIITETLGYLESLQFATTAEGREACSRLRRQIISKNEIDDFLTHFQKVNSKFIDKLHSAHPELSSNDVRFICYIHMQLSNKEISALLNITTNSCKKRRQRIAAKMGLEDASKLYSYISTL